MRHMTLRARRRTAWMLAILLTGALWTGYAGTSFASVVLAESYIDALLQEEPWDVGAVQAPDVAPALPDAFEGPAVEGTDGLFGASGDGGSEPGGMDAGNDAGGILSQDAMHPPAGLSSSGEPIGYGADTMPDEVDALSDGIYGIERNRLPDAVDPPAQALPEAPLPGVPPEDTPAVPLPGDSAEGNALLSDARVEHAAPDVAVACVRGEPVTVAIPLVYCAPDGAEIRLDDPSAYAQENSIAPDSRRDPLLYSQDILFYADRVYVEPVADELFPLDRTGMIAHGTVVEHGLNHGYAVFEGLQVPQDVADGEQTALFRVQWREVGQDVMRETRIAVKLRIVTEAGAGMDDGETSGGADADESADAEGSLPVNPSGDESTEADGTAPEPPDQAMPDAEESGVEESNAAKPDVENSGVEKADETAADEERAEGPETPELQEVPDTAPGADPQTDPDADTATGTDGKDEALPDRQHPTGDPSAERPDTGEMALPRVTLADTQKVNVSAGEMVRLALPLRYMHEETICDTHIGPDGAVVSDADAANGAPLGQDIGVHVSALWVQLEPTQFTSSDCPIVADDALLAPRKVVDGAHNAGYAVFDPVWVLAGITPGDYPIHLRIHWTDTQGVVASYPQTITLSVVAPAQEAAQAESRDPQALLDVLEIPPISLTLPQRADSLMDIRQDVPMATGEGMASDTEAAGSLTGDEAAVEVPEGDAVALAVPIAVHTPAGTLHTNSAPDGDASVPYRPGQTTDVFTQQGLEALEGLSLTLVDAPPLQLTGDAVLQPVVQDGINRGYALLENVSLAPDAQPGEYTLTFEARLDGMDTEAVRTLQVPLWLQTPVEAAVLSDTMDMGILAVDAVSSATIRTDALDISVTPSPVTLAVSVALRIDDTLYVTNHDTQNQPVSYVPGQGAAPFGQDIMQVVQSIVIEPDDTFADDAFAPFAASELAGQSGTLAAAGENHGYATFAGVTLLPDAFDATYALPFRVQITLADGTAVDPILCMLSLTLTGTGSAAETRYEVGLTGDPIVFSDGKDLAIPATFWLLTDPNERFTTNLDDQGIYVPYGESAASFSQSIPSDFTRLSVSLDPSQFGEDDFPLSVSGMQAGPVLLDGGVNNGYAAIGGLARKPDSAFGSYTVRVIFSWHEGGRQTAYTKVVPMTLEIRPSAADLATAGQVSIDPVSVYVELLAGNQTSTVTLPFAATYTVPTASGNLSYHTNASAEDPTSMLSYLFGSQPASYDQSREGPQGMPGTSILATGITDMRIAFTPEQEPETSDPANPGYPFDSYPPDPVPVIENGQNLGFSVFSGLRLRPGLTQSFSFNVTLFIQWRTEGQPEGEWNEDLLLVPVQIDIGSDWQLYGIRHDDGSLTGTIVFIYAQYKAAIESGLFDIVYLGFNDGSAGLPPRYVDLNNQAGSTYVNAQPGGAYGTIQYPNDLSFRGISVPRNIIIDGRDPNLPDKLQHIEESTNSPLTSGRGLNLGTAGLTITLRNVEMKNYNYYGSVYAGSVANTGAVLENVRWIGNQMTYMYGTDAFIAFDGDCYIEVAQQSTGYAQEVGEIPQVFVRGGTTTIQHGSTTSSVFRRTHTVQVAKGAALNVQCNESFLYRDTFDTAVQVDGTLTLRTGEKTGCFVNANNYLAGMNIGSAGVVRIDHVPISGSSGNASLRTRGLSIAPGGRLEIWRTANSSTSTNAAALYLQSGGSGLSLDNPGRVIVYSASTPVVYTNSSVTASINTDAINLWRNDTNNANDIDNMPTFLWSSDLAGAGTSRTALSVAATLNGARVTALSTSGLGSYNLGNQPVRSDATYANYALNADNFAMNNKGMLVLGRQRLSLDKLPLNGKHVSGITSPSGQAVRLFEYEGDMAGDAFFVDPTKMIPRQATQTPLPVSGGRFAGDFDSNILTEKTAVFTLLQNDYLKSYAYSFMPGYVDFLELPPGDIHFTPLYIDGVDQIACRDDASADIGFAILDTRARPEDPSDPAPEWKLMVRMESYLSTGTYGQPGYYSFDASEKGGLAYVDPEPMYPDYMRRVEEPIRLPYDQTAIEIAASSAQDASSEFPIDWTRDAGLVFELPAYAGQAGDYAGVVVWEIYRGP